VFRASSRLTREQGNEIIGKLLPKYEDAIFNPPNGSSFQDLYDVESLEPKPEWKAMERKVAGELSELGIDLGREGI
jgi:methylamine--corrinoid protein Co-methyltransferase